MTPLYFPFTCITEPVLKKIELLFGKIAIYQPSRIDIPAGLEPYENQEILEIRFPLDGKTDELKLAQKLLQYKAAGTEMGAEIIHHKLNEDKVPYYNDTSISNIKSKIKNAQKQENEKQTPEEASQIFLHFAQDYDFQNNDLNVHLKTFQDKEKDLLDSFMRYNEDDEDAFYHSRILATMNDPGSYKTKERLMAWATLFKHDSEENQLIITSSKAVIDFIQEYVDSIEKIFHVNFSTESINDSLKEELKENIRKISSGICKIEDMNLSNNKNESSLMTFYEVPGYSMAEMIAKVTGKNLDGIRNGNGNAIIGLIDVS